MSLVSGDMVAVEDSVVEERLPSEEQAARETSANAARQERMRFFVIFISG
jgi:hypothetical protein